MGKENKKVVRDLGVRLKERLRESRSLFRRKTWRAFFEHLHGRSSDSMPKVPSEDLSLNLEILKVLDIPDFAPAYGGVRGRTLSSRNQGFAWPSIRDAGVKTIIDLREDGETSRLDGLCKKYGLKYFYYPVDNRCDNIENMIKLFPEFCRHIDAGNFYIACAMGLHRTDIALCLYWVFHAADKGIVAPEIRGYRKDQGHNTDKIMRVINKFYKYKTESSGKEPMPPAVLKARKAIIKANAEMESN